MAPAAVTERLVPVAPVVEAVALTAPRVRGSRRTLVAVLVGLLAIVAVVAAIISANSLRQQTAGSMPAPISSTTTSPAVIAEPISYPVVEGDLGETLSALQRAVGAVTDTAVANELGDYVLAITQSSANGDVERARDQLDELIAAVDAAQLSAAERDDITSAADDVGSELDSLIHDADKPGKSDDKPGKNP
jgi:uncharacterized protein (DUF1499 family)